MWLVLIWGKRQREKRLGFAADYCPICRKVERFELMEQRFARHFWFIPVERGRLTGNTQICRGCQTETKSFPAQFIHIDRSARNSLESLIQETNPSVCEANKDRLALAEQIAAGSAAIDATTRHRLIMEAFALAEPHFRIGYGHQGRRILALALRPLSPREEEVRLCLQRYRESGSRMGARLRTDDVMVSVYPETEVKDPNKFSY